MRMSIKEFLLKEWKDNEKLTNKIKNFDIGKNPIFQENWLSSLFWETIATLQMSAGNNFILRDDIVLSYDLSHQSEVKLLIIQELGKNYENIFGIKYASSENSGDKLYSNSVFEIMIIVKKTVTEYKKWKGI